MRSRAQAHAWVLTSPAASRAPWAPGPYVQIALPHIHMLVPPPTHTRTHVHTHAGSSHILESLEICMINFFPETSVF